MPALPRISRETLGPSRFCLEGGGNDNDRDSPWRETKTKSDTSTPNHPVISLLQVLRQHFGDRTREARQQRRPSRVWSDGDGDSSCNGDDDEFLRIEFSTVDDVIQFYRSDSDDDDNEDWERIGGDRNGATTAALVDDDPEDDAIVSSWIDNFHILLAEQEKRERKRNKKVRFETDTTTEIDGADNDNDGDDRGCSRSSSPTLSLSADTVGIVAAAADDDDDASSLMASSCCSSSTESTWRSLDTLEEREFEEFANRWSARGIHGKNTDRSLWRRVLREVIVGPSDEDFEVHENSDVDDGSLVAKDGDDVATAGDDDNGVVLGETRENHGDDASVALDLFSGGRSFCTDDDHLPNDLLFSVENQ